jgi:DNA-binding NarL/FixJ family response regulator
VTATSAVGAPPTGPAEVLAARLVVPPRTVKHHVAHICSNIGRRTRAGAAMSAMEPGLSADG